MSVFIQNCFIQIETDKHYCSNDSILRDYVDKLVEVLDMTVIIPTISTRLPIVTKNVYRDKNQRAVKPEDCGITSLTGIAESHIALHSWTEYGYIYIEISSCKKFDADKIEMMTQEFFPGCRVRIWNDTRMLTPLH